MDVAGLCHFRGWPVVSGGGEVGLVVAAPVAFPQVGRGVGALASGLRERTGKGREEALHAPVPRWPPEAWKESEEVTCDAFVALHGASAPACCRMASM